MLASAIAQVGFLGMAGAILLALAADERWLRLSALLHLANWLLIAVCQDHRHPAFQQTDFAIDVLGAALTVLIVVRSGKLWAASICAFQWLGVLSRLSPIIDPSIHHRAAVTALYVLDLGTLVSLSVGAGTTILANFENQAIPKRQFKAMGLVRLPNSSRQVR